MDDMELRSAIRNAENRLVRQRAAAATTEALIEALKSVNTTLKTDKPKKGVS